MQVSAEPQIFLNGLLSEEAEESSHPYTSPLPSQTYWRVPLHLPDADRASWLGRSHAVQQTCTTWGIKDESFQSTLIIAVPKVHYSGLVIGVWTTNPQKYEKESVGVVLTLPVPPPGSGSSSLLCGHLPCSIHQRLTDFM